VSSESDGVDLRQLFLRKQESLAAHLQEARSVIPHSGELGTASELRWLEMLQKHLPKRYNVRKGFVIDSNGDCSDQIDIIIHDNQYSPFLLEAESTCFVPAESVYAVFDSKQTLTKGEIEYAGKKAASVRRLHRTSAQIHHLGGVSDGPNPKEIIGGILALESNWSPPFGSPFGNAIGDLAGDEALQIGCALRHGAFDAYRDDDDDLHLSVSEPEVALVTFFLGLLQLLQRMGTVPALDLVAYARSLAP
jgi:hypothetical protein